MRFVMMFIISKYKLHGDIIIMKIRTKMRIIHVRTWWSNSNLDQLMLILPLLGICSLWALQPVLPDEILDLDRVDMVHQHPTAPCHQGQGFVLWQVGVGCDDVLPDAACHDPPELVHQGGVGAGVVEHHHRPVLNIVQPSLDRNKLVLSKLSPHGSMVSKGWNWIIVGQRLIHAEVLGVVSLGHIVTRDIRCV